MRLFGSPLIYDHADFRLLDAEPWTDSPCIMGTICFCADSSRDSAFVRISSITTVPERFAGESKYTLKKMLKLAAKGATSGRLKPAETPREPYGHTREVLPL
jgi:hypothetical protein